MFVATVPSPYIARQMGYFLEGYAVLGQVYDAYETVYGASSLIGTRSAMNENLTGDANPFLLSCDYFKQYRRYFVNKSNSTNIKLSPYLRVECDLGKNVCTEFRDLPKSSPSYMTGNPLSASQVKALAAYCKEKNTTLFDFLVNKMQFNPVMMNKAKKSNECMFLLSPFDLDPRSGGLCKYYYPTGSLVHKNDIYLATGAQNYDRSEGTMAFVGTMIGGYMQAIKMTEKGAGDKKVKFFDNKYDDYHCTVLFFEAY